jgi:hypothetical protein
MVLAGILPPGRVSVIYISYIYHHDFESRMIWLS